MLSKNCAVVTHPTREMAQCMEDKIATSSDSSQSCAWNVELHLLDVFVFEYFAIQNGHDRFLHFRLVLSSVIDHLRHEDRQFCYTEFNGQNVSGSPGDCR